MRLAVEDDRCVSAAAQELVAILDRIDRIASRFRDDSALSRANRCAGKPVAIPRALVELLSVALDAAEQTAGAVDPTVGASLQRWGYDRDIADIALDGPVGFADSPAVSWRQVRLDRRIGLLTVPPGTSLDLGATAKAHTADHAAHVLHQRFDTAVMVELGGDLAIAGDRPGGWPIRVAEHESGPGQTIVLHHGGLATSSMTVRCWQRGGRLAHHLIDPRTGAPAASCWRTVTVAADTAVAANTASTAAIVLGERARAWLTERRAAARLVARDGRISTTAGWPGVAHRMAS